MKTKKILHNEMTGGQPLPRNVLIRATSLFIGIFLFLALFDSLVDVLLTLIHFIFEFIEFGLEFLLAAIFQISDRQSEIVIVNGGIVLGLLCFLPLYLLAPELLAKLKKSIHDSWNRFRKREADTWRCLPLIAKIELTAVYFTGITLLIFFLTL